MVKELNMIKMDIIIKQNINMVLKMAKQQDIIKMEVSGMNPIIKMVN